MKISVEQLSEVLERKPLLTKEEEIKEVFGILGLRVKEYSKVGLQSSQVYEVHYRRTYLFEVQVDNSRCLSLSNEFINFGDHCHGVSFGGIDTVKELIRTVIMMAEKIRSGYTGEAIYNEDESEYTADE